MRLCGAVPACRWRGRGEAASPSGQAVKPHIPPGERKRVTLVALRGERLVYGGNGWIDGKLDEAGRKQQALEKLEK